MTFQFQNLCDISMTYLRHKKPINKLKQLQCHLKELSLFPADDKIPHSIKTIQIKCEFIFLNDSVQFAIVVFLYTLHKQQGRSSHPHVCTWVI